MTITQKGRELIGNQKLPDWATEKKRDIMFMIKSRKESETAKQLTNVTHVQTLICQHEIMLKAVLQHHENMMRYTRNCTVASTS
jgi:hypothetical protein